MSDLLIDNVQVMQPGEGRVGSSLLLRDGKIARIGGNEAAGEQTIERVDGEGRSLTPGLMDVHTHGVGHYLYEASPGDLIEGVAQLGRFGTTCVLPTFYTVFERSTLAKFEALAKAVRECKGVSIPGFHLEGPFLALPGAGAATLAGDVGLLDEILAASGGGGGSDVDQS